MKNKLIKKLTILLIVVMSSFSLISCGDDDTKTSTKKDSSISQDKDEKDEKEDKDVDDQKDDAASFETQEISLDECSFEIPKTWTEIETAVTAAKCYAPADYDMTKGTSSVNIVINKNTGIKDANELMKAKDTLKSSITNLYSDATNFEFEICSSNLGDALTMSYVFTYNDVTFNTIQYMMLTDDNYYVVTATDIGDSISPSSVDVAKNLISTIKEK